MKSLWNMLNKEFTIEGAVSAFLVINIIAWTLITMGVGMLVCKFLVCGNLWRSDRGIDRRNPVSV